jgi:NitT/TauT family transport system permease protein
VVTILVWQAATWVFEIRPLYLPSPWRIAVSMYGDARVLFDASLVTAFEVLAGFALGASAGLLCAALLALAPSLERATRPLVVALNAVPMVALAPLLTLWLGPRYAPHLTLTALICYFPILIAALAGLTSTPVELDELARSWRATRWQTLVKIRLPWALPRAFAGLRLGMALAVIGTVVGQLAHPSGGLGATILVAAQDANATRALAAIVPLTVVSILLTYAVAVTGRLLLPWAAEASTTAAAVM